MCGRQGLKSLQAIRVELVNGRKNSFHCGLRMQDIPFLMSFHTPFHSLPAVHISYTLCLSSGECKKTKDAGIRDTFTQTVGCQVPRLTVVEVASLTEGCDVPQEVFKCFTAVGCSVSVYHIRP